MRNFTSSISSYYPNSMKGGNVRAKCVPAEINAKQVHLDNLRLENLVSGTIVAV